MRFFRLTDFSSDPFELSSSKRDKQVVLGEHSNLLEPYALLYSKNVIHWNCFEETFSMWRAVLLHLKYLTPPPPPSVTPSPALRASQHSLMLASLSPSWLLPEPTARRLFDNNWPDGSRLCMIFDFFYRGLKVVGSLCLKPIRRFFRYFAKF